ncbi:MAG: hypothetical protein ATN36_07925 [Epulopiscium sp. Nele67-Bin005]|nr:MAG: hypothetical protein ATN36_07925 [Epulopiscium sp. Nele67-Bin005]
MSYNDLEQQDKDILHTASDLTQLVAGEIKDEFKSQIEKQKIRNKVDELKDEYSEMVHSVKEKITNQLDKF